MELGRNNVNTFYCNNDAYTKIYFQKKVHSNDKQYSLYYFASELKPQVERFKTKRMFMLASEGMWPIKNIASIAKNTYRYMCDWEFLKQFLCNSFISKRVMVPISYSSLLANLIL